ncbi:Uncharacterised protein [Citrobacter koseri]|nr:Uncharacterised protein [Citrobacter koseri]
MSNIDKRPYHADGGDIGTGRIREIADNPYGDEEKCWLAKRVLALLDKLEVRDKQVAELVTDRLNLQWILNVYAHAYEEAKEQIAKDVEIKSRLCRESNSLFDRLRAAEKRIAELRDWNAGLAQESFERQQRLAELEAKSFNPAILDVIAERQRQRSVEGWTSEHDDEHSDGEMALAASSYALYAHKKANCTCNSI